MSTLVNWFANVTQARDAVLDLLTSGVPREDISAVINASGDGHLHDFVGALPGASAVTLPDIGSVVVAGPLADALVSTDGSATGGGLRSALMAVGVTEEQAQMYTEQLCHGGALLAVRSDSSWDTIVCGVFRHNANPSFDEQEERVGSTPENELAADEVGGPISTSIGALTGGTIPGDWGEAGDVFEEQLEDATADDRRREPDL